MPLNEDTGVFYEVHGRGAPLFIGFPIMASHEEIFGPEAGKIKQAFLDQFTDQYRVLLVDYPSIGKSRDIAPSELTADRVCDDLLKTASAAGFNRFAYWGYSWGAAVGLQLSLRTDRLTALVMGGWPPLGAAYALALKASCDQIANPPKEVQVVLRSPAQYAQWSTFYRSIEGFDELGAAQGFKAPRLAYVGGEGDVGAGDEMILNATIMRERRRELEDMGWRVAIIDGEGHDVGLKPQIVGPIVRQFLDESQRG